MRALSPAEVTGLVEMAAGPPAIANLTEILAAASLAMRIETQAGAVIFENRTMVEMRARAAEPRLRKINVGVGGVQYTVSVASDDQDEAALREELFRKAYFDALTGLPNRSFVEQTVAALIEDGAKAFALAFVDLDGFKQINDYYGHVIGDRLLAKISERLTTGLTGGNMVARLSGDEFILLFSNFDGAGDLRDAIETISAQLKRPIYVDGFEIMVSASIGVSLFPDHGDCFDALRSSADSAMYRSKRATKGSVLFFDPSIQHAVRDKAKLEQRVRLAIRDCRTCCAYQPKVNFRTSEISGVEALLRWRDEDGMIMPPGEFVGLATELGLMNGVTDILVDQIIDQIDRINASFGRSASISLNIAARQAEDARFMKSLVGKLAATGFAQRFMLEITEEAFFAKSNFQTLILPMIREIGAKVSIDDFGVGYSSLSALADITADELKVDRSFITDLHRRARSQSILKAIESLGNSLGMNIVVEGVETFEELAYLQAATRINTAQGFYFSKPVHLDSSDIGDGVLSNRRITEASRANPPARVVEGRGRQASRG